MSSLTDQLSSANRMLGLETRWRDKAERIHSEQLAHATELKSKYV